MKRFLSIILVLTVVSMISGSFVGRKGTTTSTASISTTSITTPLKQATIIIGTSTPLTGPAASYGLGVMHGVQLAFDDANAAGGLTVGDTHYTFKVISLDDQYDTATSTNVVRTLVNQDGAQYLFNFNTDTAVALESELNTEKVIDFTVCTNDAILDNAASSYTFRTANAYTMHIPLWTSWIAKNYPNAKTMSLIALNNTQGNEGLTDSIAAAKASNFTINSSVLYDQGTTDFTPFLTKILASNPDMLMITAAPTGDAALIIKQARNSGYKGLIAAQPKQAAKDMISIAGEADLEGVITDSLALVAPQVSPVILGLPAREVAKWGTSYGVTWDFYCEATLMFNAMQRANSVDTTAVKNILQDPTQVWPYLLFPGSTSAFDAAYAKSIYGANAINQITNPFAICVIHNGQDTIAAITSP